MTFELDPNPPATFKNPVKGYAAAPGGGPAGEKCKTCAHAYHWGGGGRAYIKCALVLRTAGPGTDIRLKSPACWRWAPKGSESHCLSCQGKGRMKDVKTTNIRGGRWTTETLIVPCRHCNGSGKRQTEKV